MEEEYRNLLVELFTGKTVNFCKNTMVCLSIDSLDEISKTSIDVVVELSEQMHELHADVKALLQCYIQKHNIKVGYMYGITTNIYTIIMYILQYKCTATINDIVIRLTRKKVDRVIRHGEYKMQHYEPNIDWLSGQRNCSDEVIPIIMLGPVNVGKRTNDKAGDDNMRIKKTDELTIEEFKETEKAYDKVFVVFDMEKYEKIIKEYGDEVVSHDGQEVNGFEMYGKSLDDVTIEFYPKAISVRSDIHDKALLTIPYYIVSKLICTYYIEK